MGNIQQVSALAATVQELQKEAKFWRKQRVPKKIGSQWKRGDNKYHEKINELLSDENVAAAIIKYIRVTVRLCHN